MFHVLHVDDESDIREVVEIALGFEPDLTIRSCSSGSEALLAAVECPPDIILLDVMMPVMDGPTALALLRDDSRTAGIPVVFMTARVQARELEFFRSLGAVGVIAKPFDPMTLAASVRAHLPAADLFDSRLDALRMVFLRRVGEEAIELMECRTSLQMGHVARETWIRIGHIAHGLAGAGGIFGFPDISRAAAALEEAVTAKRVSSDCEEISCILDGLLLCMELNKNRDKQRLPSMLRAY